MSDLLREIRLIGCVCVLGATLAACGNSDDAASNSKTAGNSDAWHTMTVTASAYTIAADETDNGTPGQAAWGDILKPGMRAIAVSRDLIKMGLDHGTKVRIEGLDGTFVVLDKMNKRWKKKIDILMPSKKKARQWGKKKVTIRWKPAPEKNK